jgi:hypothetical protein
MNRPHHPRIGEEELAALNARAEASPIQERLPLGRVHRRRDVLLLTCLPDVCRCCHARQAISNEDRGSAPASHAAHFAKRMTLMLRARTRGASAGYPEVVDPPLPQTRSKARRALVTFDVSRAQCPSGHEGFTRVEVARRLARLMGFDFWRRRRSMRISRRAYFVPSDTLMASSRASALSRRTICSAAWFRRLHGDQDDHASAHRVERVRTPGLVRQFPRLVADSVLAATAPSRRRMRFVPARCCWSAARCGEARLGIAGVSQWPAENVVSLAEILMPSPSRTSPIPVS